MKKPHKVFLALLAVAIGVAAPVQQVYATFPADQNKELVFVGGEYANQPSGGSFTTIKPDGSNKSTVGSIAGMNPSWSPDGKTIAYMKTSGPNDFDMFVANADGTNNHLVSTLACLAEVLCSPFSVPRPMWSPDGTQLAVRLDNNDLRLYNVDGSGTTDIAPFTGIDQPGLTESITQIAWSADNTFAVTVNFLDEVDSSQVKTSIFTVKPNGGSLAEIVQTAPSMSVQSLSWSPDSARLLVNDGNNLLVYTRSGTLEQTFALRSLLSLDPIYAIWSPDGKKIAFSAGDEGDNYDAGEYDDTFVPNLFVMDVAGGISTVQVIAAAGSGGSGIPLSFDWRGITSTVVTPPVTPPVAAPNAPDTGAAPSLSLPVIEVMAGLIAVLLLGGTVCRLAKNKL